MYPSLLLIAIRCSMLAADASKTSPPPPVPIVRFDSSVTKPLTPDQVGHVLVLAECARPAGAAIWFVRINANYKPLLSRREFSVTVFYTPDKVDGRLRWGRKLSIHSDGASHMLYHYVQVLPPGRAHDELDPPKIEELPMHWDNALPGLDDDQLISLVDATRAALENGDGWTTSGPEFISTIEKRDDIYEIYAADGHASGRFVRMKHVDGRWLPDGSISRWRS